MKKFESAIDFQQFAKTLNIEELQQLSIELSKKHKQVFEQYENELLAFAEKLDLRLKSLYARKIVFTSKEDDFVDFEIFCDEKEFGMPENGYKISMSIPSFGTFDFSDKNSKYIKFYKSVGKFLSDDELMQEFENTVIKYVTELFPISDKISIVGNVFHDYKLKQYKKEQSAESLKIAKKLKETFDSMDLSDKYVAITDALNEYSYTVTYRNKKYVCLTEIPKTKDEIENEVLADKNMKRDYRNRYLIIVPAKRVKTRDNE